MLDFADQRWRSLETTYDCDDVVALVRKWHASIGFDQELPQYQLLSNQFMHQCTITDLAFAMVPHLVATCEANTTSFTLLYLTDVGVTEANRLSPGSRAPDLPAFLADAYSEAIIRAQPLAEAAIDSAPECRESWELRAIKPALFGNAELAWNQWRNGFDNAN